MARVDTSGETFLRTGSGRLARGSIADLGRRMLPGEFRLINPSDIRVVLFEARDRVLTSFEPLLPTRAPSIWSRWAWRFAPAKRGPWMMAVFDNVQAAGYGQ